MYPFSAKRGALPSEDRHHRPDQLGPGLAGLSHQATQVPPHLCVHPVTPHLPFHLSMLSQSANPGYSPPCPGPWNMKDHRLWKSENQPSFPSTFC